MKTEPELSDAELVTRIVAGEEEALVRLYHRWRPTLHRFALGMTGSAATADDVVQETFITSTPRVPRTSASTSGTTTPTATGRR